MDVNPYAPPKYLGTQDRLGEELMENGERILFQIAARSYSGKDRLVHFGYPVIGKLVLTNRRVFFLSSGKGEGIGFVTEVAMIKGIAKSLDMTALQRTGAWEYSISEVRSVEASRRPLLQGPCLRVVGRDKYGEEVSRQVYRSGIRRTTWENVAAMINEVKERGAAALENDL